MTDKNLRVLVVDDSAYNRQTIKGILVKIPGLEVVGVSTDGLDAMSKTIRLKPDMITLDIEMPEMDGFTFLRWLMKEYPTPVLMISSHSDPKTIFSALELGAVDFIEKPTGRASEELKNIERDLVTKVQGIKNLNIDVLSRNISMMEERTKDKAFANRIDTDISLVAIGSSTGGPSAIQMILSELPKDLPSPVVISQHMPPGFTGSLSERLNKICSLRIKEAEHSEEVKPGTAYICPGGYHMSFKKAKNLIVLTLKKTTEKHKYTPSVDIMMNSAAKSFTGKIMGIVLTGMGNDGADGMVNIKKKGGYTVAESEETAIVFGMPKEVIKAKAADEILPLDMIASEIRRTCMGERRK